MKELAELEIERYSDPQGFAQEVNLPLLGVSTATPVPAGASASELLSAVDPEGMRPVVDLLTQTRCSLPLRSLLLTGFPQDPEFFAAGLALAREWSRLKTKVAVIDLDFWHPTVVRPRPHPNEGFVDVLEYGCSFRRVAWEIVADALWVIGPGSHPPDEGRIAGHPDWDRALRVLSARVDVALYLAPLLDRKGLTGRISKRMDGVLLAASIEREGRAGLRDAFLELWGSDAPMIGCIGIGPRHLGETGPRHLAEAGPRHSAEAGPLPEGTTATPSATAVPEPSLEVVLDATAPAETPLRGTLPSGLVAEDRRREPSHEELVTALMDEVRSGGRPRAESRRRLRRGILAGCIVVGIAAGVYAGAVMLKRPPGSKAFQETLPAGTEPTLPAGNGSTSPAGQGPTLPEDPGGPGLAAPPKPTPAPTAPRTEATPGAPAPGRAAAPAPGRAAAPGPPGIAAPAPPGIAAPAPGLAAPRAAEAGPYRVHVASFRSETKVRTIAEDLRGRGLDAWYERAADRPGWYRVFVGRFATHAEAEARASWLLDHGLVDRARGYPNAQR